MTESGRQWQGWFGEAEVECIHESVFNYEEKGIDLNRGAAVLVPSLHTWFMPNLFFRSLFPKILIYLS